MCSSVGNTPRKGSVRYIRRLAVTVVIATVTTTIAAVVANADLPKAFFTPDRILKGTTPTITMTLDVANQEITTVRLAGQVVSVQKLGETFIFQLPKLDIVGVADVEVIGKGDKSVAVGQIHYVIEKSSEGLWLLFMYAVFIILPPALYTWYDISKSYAERFLILGSLNNATADDIKALLAAMDRGPTGFTGLTRGIVSVTLILVLAIAIFHLVVFGNLSHTVPEQLLTLLAGSVTSIVGFYFGSKATAEATAEATKCAQPSGAKTAASIVPKILECKSNVVSAGHDLTIIGEGFGKQKGQGKVQFNNQDVPVNPENWTETSIRVTAPAGLPSGEVNVVVTNDSGKSSEPGKIHFR